MLKLTQLVLLLSLVATLGCRPKPGNPSAQNPPTQEGPPVIQPPPIELAKQLQSRGDLAGAFRAVEPILISNPNHVDALRIVVAYHASKSQFCEAAEVARQLATLSVPDPVSELLSAFDWHLRCGDQEAAEEDLQQAVQRSPNDPRPHRSLAQLLNSQGRRYEAAPHVIALARSGAIAPREILSLIEIGGPFQLVAFDEVVGDSSGTLFDLGRARHLYVAEGDADAALETLDRLAEQKSTPAVEALRGRILADDSSDERFLAWIKDVPPGIDQHPEYWLAIGTWLSRQGRDAEAVRAFGEALHRDPTDRRSLRSISASLNRLGDSEKAKQAQETLAVLDTIFRKASSSDPDQAMWIAGQLESLVRPWESVAWYRQAFQLQGTFERHVAELTGRVAKIREWESAAGNEKIRDARTTKMLGFDVAEFPMPDIVSFVATRSGPDPGRLGRDLKFEEIADSLGVRTSFVSEYRLDAVDFYLYQANGGGLAVLDYDLDGGCDLYVVQSGGDPNQPGSSVANQLYRQLSDTAFDEVTEVSKTASPPPLAW